MQTYRGGCHCGRVRFEISADVDTLIECNCSVCTKKGILHIGVEDHRFKLLLGEQELSLYQFRTNTAKHFFCKHCGIHPFGRPRTDPSRYTVNARCLDDFDAISTKAGIKPFNGKDHPSDRRSVGVDRDPGG